jgi:hypothetical protein
VREEGTEARRHAGTEWGPGGEGASADERVLHLVPCCLRHHFAPSCPFIASPSVRLPRCCVFVITEAQRLFISMGNAGEFAWKLFWNSLLGRLDF